MAKRSSIHVSLPSALKKFVQAGIASGRYSSADEVVSDGLRLLQDREAERNARLDQLKTEIASGLKQARRGELIDGESVFKELDRQFSRGRRTGGDRKVA